jgi:hypothetical protein
MVVIDLFHPAYPIAPTLSMKLSVRSPYCSDLQHESRVASNSRISDRSLRDLCGEPQSWPRCGAVDLRLPKSNRALHNPEGLDAACFGEEIMQINGDSIEQNTTDNRRSISEWR